MFRCKLCPKSYAVRRTLIRHLRRRHFLKGTNAVMKEFFQTMDPRDCNLGLDEETMNKIFGPPKKKKVDIVIGDYATMKKLAENYRSNAEEREAETGEEGSEDEKEEEASDQVMSDLEPTDFVSVKIEPLDPMEEEYE